MNKTEFNRLVININRVTSLLQVEPYDPQKQTQPRYCYSLKINAGCVRETADLWIDWAEFWDIDSFITNYSDQYIRITQVTLRIFDPSELTEPSLLEGPQHCYLIYDIRSRLSDDYLYGKEWPYE